MNANDPMGGSPPMLWLNRIFQRRGPQHELRLRRLAGQIEKLSWMLEYMGECNRYDQENSNDVLVSIEGAEEEWQHERASRS